MRKKNIGRVNVVQVFVFIHCFDLFIGLFESPHHRNANMKGCKRMKFPEYQ